MALLTEPVTLVGLIGSLVSMLVLVVPGLVEVKSSLAAVLIIVANVLLGIATAFVAGKDINLVNLGIKAPQDWSVAPAWQAIKSLFFSRKTTLWVTGVIVNLIVMNAPAFEAAKGDLNTLVAFALTALTAVVMGADKAERANEVAAANSF